MLDKRIAYYTRKVAQFGKNKNQYRYDRLLLYKAILNKRIQEGSR